MTIKINEMPSGNVGISAPHRGGITLDHGEQRELLEALARIHGFSLVDREERRSLIELVEEVRGLRASALSSAIARAAEALAATVAEALELDGTEA